MLRRKKQECDSAHRQCENPVREVQIVDGVATYRPFSSCCEDECDPPGPRFHCSFNTTEEFTFVPPKRCC